MSSKSDQITAVNKVLISPGVVFRQLNHIEIMLHLVQRQVNLQPISGLDRKGQFKLVQQEIHKDLHYFIFC
jgi:hypothetical protein